jgi:hypothetical protein
MNPVDTFFTEGKLLIDGLEKLIPNKQKEVPEEWAFLEDEARLRIEEDEMYLINQHGELISK